MKCAGTVEKLRAAAAPGATAFISAGDLIGASLFASAVSQGPADHRRAERPGPDASAVGNHEFDKGLADLRDRVIARRHATPSAPYLGANVYAKGTTDPGPAGVHGPGHRTASRSA